MLVRSLNSAFGQTFQVTKGGQTSFVEVIKNTVQMYTIHALGCEPGKRGDTYSSVFDVLYD